MSTTVKYKGDTLTTVDNATKTLKTAGTYLEGDIELTDVSEEGGAQGTAYQDENGYLVLDPGVPNAGLTYETGTFTPTSDVATYNIAFSKTYATLPFLTLVLPALDAYDSTLNSAASAYYLNWDTLLGVAVHQSSTTIYYGASNYRYRGTNATSTSSGTSTINYPDSNTGSNTTSYPRFWATESGMKAYSGTTSAYFRSGKTYRWIAVWPPSVQ